MTDAAAPSKPPIRDLTLLALRIVVGGLFVFAATVKLNDLHGFAEAVKGFKLFPAPLGDHLILVTTFAMPWAELILGALLLLGLWTREAAALTTLLLLGFCVALYSVIARDMTLTCGCFGKIDFICTGPVGWCSVVRNLVHAALAVAVLALGPGRWSLDARRR